MVCLSVTGGPQRPLIGWFVSAKLGCAGSRALLQTDVPPASATRLLGMLGVVWFWLEGKINILNSFVFYGDKMTFGVTQTP